MHYTINGYYVYVYLSDRNPLKRAQTQTYSQTDGASEMLMNEEIEQDYHRISLP